MSEDKPRRPKGSGSIYTRKDGRVVGEYEANGKKRYVYGKTKQEVAAKLAKAIADRDAGLVYDSRRCRRSSGTESGRSRWYRWWCSWCSYSGWDW